MPATEFNWKTKEGNQIYAKHWAVESPQAVICLVHGIGEHCNRYNHFAEFYNQNNISVLGMDLPGHGQTTGKLGHANGIEAFMDEVAQLLVEAVENYPETPIFLYGHSMGGNIVLNYLLRRHPQIKGVIASGPWIRVVENPPALLLFAAKILNRIAPSLVMSTELDGSKVSRDPKVVEDYLNDPLVHAKASPRLATSMMKAAAFLNEYSGEIKIPTLIMHGSADGLTSQPASREFANRVSGDITYKIWEGLFHEIHNEKEQKEVFKYNLKWILKYC